MSGNGNHGKQTADEYIRELESKLYDGKFVKTKAEHYTEYVIDGTANTEFCDCDKIERECWWHLPVTMGAIVLAYGLGWVSAAWFVN